MQVVWQATNEDFAELRIDLVSRAQGLLPNTLECAQLLLIFLHLLIRESLSLRQLMLQRIYKLHCLLFEGLFFLNVLCFRIFLEVLADHIFGLGSIFCISLGLGNCIVSSILALLFAAWLDLCLLKISLLNVILRIVVQNIFQTLLSLLFTP